MIEAVLEEVTGKAVRYVKQQKEVTHKQLASQIQNMHAVFHTQPVLVVNEDSTDVQRA